MTLELQSAGTGTLPKSTPGAYSSVVVTDSAATTGDVIQLTPTTVVKDGQGPFGVYVASIDTGTSFTVTSTKRQLPSDLTFNYLIHDTA